MAPSKLDVSPAASEVNIHPSGDPDLAFPKDDAMHPPVFKDKYEERNYLKHRLALAFRIFASPFAIQSIPVLSGLILLVCVTL